MSAATNRKDKDCQSTCTVAQKISQTDQTGAFRVLNELVEVFPIWKPILADSGQSSLIQAIVRLEKNSTEQTEILKRLDSILMGDGVNDGVAKKVMKHEDFYTKGRALWWIVVGIISVLGMFGVKAIFNFVTGIR